MGISEKPTAIATAIEESPAQGERGVFLKELLNGEADDAASHHEKSRLLSEAAF